MLAAIARTARAVGRCSAVRRAPRCAAHFLFTQAAAAAEAFPHGPPRRGPLLCQESGTPVDEALLRAETEVVALPELGGLRLHLITSECRLYHANGFRDCPFPPPWWAFCWPGSYCIARYLRLHPTAVAGKRVLDFAAGGAAAGLVALQCGAERVVCNDICAWAVASCQLNAALNGTAFNEEDLVVEDLVGNGAVGAHFDVILAGDIMYEQPLAGFVTTWLRDMVRQGTRVLLGDPGRAFLPSDGLRQLASFDLPPPHVRDSSNGLHTGQVWEVSPMADT